MGGNRAWIALGRFSLWQRCKDVFRKLSSNRAPSSQRGAKSPGGNWRSNRLAKWKFNSIERKSDYFGSAVYKVRLLAGGEVVELPRFLRHDRSGILQIGVSGSFEKRRRQFVRGLASGRGHSEGNMLHILERRSALLQIFSGCSYEIAFVQMSGRDEALAEEETLIKRYFTRFGEVPPLNTQLPNRYLWE